MNTEPPPEPLALRSRKVTRALLGATFIAMAGNALFYFGVVINADTGARETPLTLWTTFHPTETTLDAYVAKCQSLRARGVRFSVGIVGKKEHVGLASELRAALPDDIYMWVNAYKSSGPGYYSKDEERALEALDSLFPINNVRHKSAGEACRTGKSVISVDGEGDIRRCHFVSEVIGNLYASNLNDVLKERPCPNARCGCHIGYVHLDRLALGARFGAGLLERIPTKNSAERTP